MNPFATTRTLRGHQCQAVDAESRIDMARRFDAEQCHAALKRRDIQKTVRAAVYRRLRRLEKEGVA